MSASSEMYLKHTQPTIFPTMPTAPKTLTPPHKRSPDFTQTGRVQTYTQRIAAKMNWWKRCMMGLQAQVLFQSGFFIVRHPEYENMSHARKNKLAALEMQAVTTHKEITALLKMIDEFQALPITLENEQKGKKPKKRKPISE